MNKIIAASLIAVFLLFIVGCAQKPATPPVEPEVKETAITEQNKAIDDASKTLGDLEDAETDAELDDIDDILGQI